MKLFNHLKVADEANNLKILIFDQMNRAIECASEKVSQAGLHQYQLLNMNLQCTSLPFEMCYV